MARSVGCIFAEMFTQKPLFPGKSEMDMLKRCVSGSIPSRFSRPTIIRIFTLLGTPNNDVWEGFTDLPHVKKVRWLVVDSQLIIDTRRSSRFRSIRSEFTPSLR